MAITWEEWKDKPMPALDKVYSGPVSKSGLWDDSENGDDGYFSEYLNDFAYELQVCREKNDDALTFEEWLALESFFGQRISYEQFHALATYYTETLNKSGEIHGDILCLGGTEPSMTPFRKGDVAQYCSYVGTVNASVKITPYNQPPIEQALKCII